MPKFLIPLAVLGVLACVDQNADAAHVPSNPSIALDANLLQPAVSNTARPDNLHLAGGCYRSGYYRPSYGHYHSYRPSYGYGGYGGYGGHHGHGYRSYYGGGYGHPGYYRGGRSGVSLYFGF